MKKKIKQQKRKTKEDLVVIALYSIFYSRYMEARKFERELIKHISNKYNMKKKDFGAEDIVTEAMYGSDMDIKDFLDYLKENTKRRK